MIFKCGMVNPIIRKIVIDEKLLLKAKGLLRNFPQISGKYEEDIRQYRKNKEIINELSYEYNLPNDSTGIDKSKYKPGEIFLIILPNPELKRVLDELIRLQTVYSKQIQNRLYTK